MSCLMSLLWPSHFIPSQQQLTAETSLTLNSTEDVSDCFPVDLHRWRRICHLHMGKLFVPTYGQREKKPTQVGTLGWLMYVVPLHESHKCNQKAVKENKTIDHHFMDIVNKSKYKVKIKCLPGSSLCCCWCSSAGWRSCGVSRRGSCAGEWFHRWSLQHTH